MGTNSLAGTIRKGSVKHVVYEAVMAHPSSDFCSKDIYEKIADAHPDIKIGAVQNMVGFVFVKMKIVARTSRVREAADSGRRLKIYERKAKAKQPIIREPGIGPAKTTRKYTRKKTPDAPTLSAIELGESIMDYVNHLQERVGELAVELDKVMQRLRVEKKNHQKTNDSMQYKVTELKKANEALKTQAEKKGSGRTFNTKDVLNFQKRKAETGGIGT